MIRSGSADLPLHGGRVPAWLSQRMSRLGGLLIEAMVEDMGTKEVLRRFSDPFWFQAFGAALGMDWHSSGLTTAVMGAIKKAVNSRSNDLGLYICGGRGRHSRKTPGELLQMGDATGLDAQALIRISRLCAKVDNTAVQDGHQIYLHNFLIDKEGNWSVIQQGMNTDTSTARRYHWHSAHLKSFIQVPHTSVCGINRGPILNLTAVSARSSRQGILDLTEVHPLSVIREARHLSMPKHHDIRMSDVNLKRLGTILYAARDTGVKEFESLLLLKGLGPRTLQTLTLLSELLYGTPSRFEDPARFAFSLGGKDGYPTPVPLQTYDISIKVIEKAVQQARLGQSDKLNTLRSLHTWVSSLEKDFVPDAKRFKSTLDAQNREVALLGGRTASWKDDDKKRADTKNKSGSANNQLELF